MGDKKENKGPLCPTESKLLLGCGKNKYEEFLWKLEDLFNLALE